MITESAQILSTAHRVLDGKIVPTYVLNKQGEYKINKKFYRHKSDTITDDKLITNTFYRVAHINHPSCIWVRQSANNYNWLYDHFKAMCELYTNISGKVHKCDSMLSEALSVAPTAIPDTRLTVPPKCMPDNIKGMYSDVTKSYKYYLNVKYKEWLDRAKPMRVEYPHLNEKPLWLEI